MINLKMLWIKFVLSVQSSKILKLFGALFSSLLFASLLVLSVSATEIVYTSPDEVFSEYGVNKQLYTPSSGFVDSSVSQWSVTPTSQVYNYTIDPISSGDFYILKQQNQSAHNRVNYINWIYMRGALPIQNITSGTTIRVQIDISFGTNQNSFTYYQPSAVALTLSGSDSFSEFFTMSGSNSVISSSNSNFYNYPSSSVFVPSSCTLDHTFSFSSSFRLDNMTIIFDGDSLASYFYFNISKMIVTITNSDTQMVIMSIDQQTNKLIESNEHIAQYIENSINSSSSAIINGLSPSDILSRPDSEAVDDVLDNETDILTDPDQLGKAWNEIDLAIRGSSTLLAPSTGQQNTYSMGLKAVSYFVQSFIELSDDNRFIHRLIYLLIPIGLLGLLLGIVLPVASRYSSDNARIAKASREYKKTWNISDSNYSSYRHWRPNTRGK